MDVLQKLGSAALGSRFRRLAERLATDAAALYREYNVDIEPAWFPVVYILFERECASVTEIAELTGHSHPFVSKTIRQMKAADIIEAASPGNDKRVNSVTLTSKGQALKPALTTQMDDVNIAMEHLLNPISPEFLTHLKKIDEALKESSLLERTLKARKHREQQAFTIIPYESQYQRQFFSLNRAWIEKHFTLEPSDIRSLTSPKEYILDRGGHILLARDAEGEICGTVALIAMPDNEFELAKMAVADNAKGKGVGLLLGNAAIRLARECGAKSLFLESNRSLVPAINLYRKLGFKEVPQQISPYERCDIQMKLKLSSM